MKKQEQIMDDKKLRQDVVDALDWDPSIDSANVGVAVNGGVVVLTGHLPSYAQKLAAQSVARRTKGVRAIADEIEVRYDGSLVKTDEEIAAQALKLLDWDVTIPMGAVKVKVAKGWVTLTGELEWEYQRRAAEADIRKLGGVLGVINSITLKRRVTPADISQRIHQALKRDAELEASHVQVTVKDGRVKLDGKVHAWHEREAIERAVWSAPGVVGVDDHLQVG